MNAELSDLLQNIEKMTAIIENGPLEKRSIAVDGLRLDQEMAARAEAGVAKGAKLVKAMRTAVEQGIEPDRALRAAGHLAEAERWQWEIGTRATGSGEGLMSMFEVRTLQLARAWLLAAVVPVEPERADEARALASEVADDSNRVATKLQRHVDALRKRLRGAPR